MNRPAIPPNSTAQQFALSGRGVKADVHRGLNEIPWKERSGPCPPSRTAH
jgi:hypothetical protein